MGVFLAHGLIQCTFGVILGLGVSWAILSNLQNIVDFLARMGMEVFPSSIYQLSEIPCRVIPSDVAYVVAVIYVFGLLASLVPALLAAIKDPVRALNE
jgi:lipoprotein-releasing system permease protein